MKLNIKIVLLIIGLAFVQSSAFGQKAAKDGFFYDTLVVMDYAINEGSERLSRMRKPLKRTFYLKTDQSSYTLFKGNVANFTANQVISNLEKGFTLFFDKMEYKDHQNLKPSILEILGEDGEPTATIENLANAKTSVLQGKMKPNTVIRLSGFIVSVNEKNLGPIQMDIKIIEEK